ncbi:MAG: PAS domain S-box protein, partial [bacterium]|nr:PAS domain S-box protein [bacterium]
MKVFLSHMALFVQTHLRMVYFGFSLFCFVVLSAVLMYKADHSMREALLEETSQAAALISLEPFIRLSGTNEDLSTPAYLSLKEMLTELKKQNEKYHFVYALGARDNGEIYLYADSEPLGSAEESLPGEVYAEATEALHSLFDTGIGFVEGPFTDRWGTFVSGVVPIFDPQSRTVKAVVGIDIDAATWRWDVLGQVAVPAMLLIMVWVGLFSVLIASRYTVDLTKPLVHHLILPIAVVLLIPIAVLVIWYWYYTETRYRHLLLSDLTEIIDDFDMVRKLKSDGMAMALQAVSTDQPTWAAMEAGDADRLYSLWEPLYETLKQRDSISQFSFIAADRTCLLRLHDSVKKGDRIDHETIRKAERTGQMQTGFEMGPLGMMTQRVVQPLMQGTTLIGFVEMGWVVEKALPVLHRVENVKFVALIRKDLLDRSLWEEGMARMGRNANWEQYPTRVVVYSTIPNIPSEHLVAVQALIQEEGGKQEFLHGKQWDLSVLPIIESSGRNVGELLVMRDISAMRRVAGWSLGFVMIGGGVFVSLLLGFLYVLLFQADRGIQEQKKLLQESQERLHATLYSIGDGVISTDAVGRVMEMNPVAETLTGWRNAEARGERSDVVLKLKQGEGGGRYPDPIEKVLQTGEVVELSNHTILVSRDGVERQIADTAAPIFNSEREIIGAVIVFRDVTEEYHLRNTLVEREKHYRALVEGSPNAVFLLDQDGQIVSTNRYASEMFGFSTDSIAGCHFVNLWSIPDRVEAEAAFRQFREGCQCCFEAASSRPDGGETEWLVMLNPIAEDPMQRFIGIAVDITEKKRAEEAVYERERYLRLILQTVVDGFWIVDGQGRIQVFNEAYCTMSGYSREQLQKMSVPDIDIQFGFPQMVNRMKWIQRMGSDAFETK